MCNGLFGDPFMAIALDAAGHVPADPVGEKVYLELLTGDKTRKNLPLVDRLANCLNICPIKGSQMKLARVLFCLDCLQVAVKLRSVP